MWHLLRDFRQRGARFRRETPIGPYSVDFAWLAAGLVIEVDGDSHKTPEGQCHDTQRDAWLASQGYTVLRFDNNTIMESEESVWLEVEARIRKFLKEKPDG